MESNYGIRPNKKILKPKTHTSKQAYEFYKLKNPTSTIPYWMYKEVISRFNKKAPDAVIFGQVLNLGHKLGNVLIKKIRRNYLNPLPDWGTSKRKKQELIDQGITPKDQTHPEGEEWIVFYTDPWYLRWAWVKKRICRVRNASVYKLMPTSDRSKKANNTDLTRLGNKGKLTLANRLDPYLHIKYENTIKS
jgi:hypothetical protein